jgi:pimeloyl-ACP methyl ester carboxylesterase
VTAPATGTLMSRRGRMLAGVPVQQRSLRLAGVSTVLLEAGDGPPLVLLHGGIECGGPVWAPVIADLAERHRVIVPDLPGFGESMPVDDLYVVLGDWFRDLVAHSCEGPPALVAHSLGGSLAARLAAERGQLVRRLVLYGTPAIGPYRMPLGLRMVAIRFGLRPTSANSERFERWAFFDYDGFRAREAEWLRAFGEEGRLRARAPHTKRAMRKLVARGTKRIPDAELQRMPVATSLIWGRHDRFVPVELAEEASARLSWPIHVIDAAGHVPHVERPDAFVAALGEVLDRTSASPAAA